MADSVAVVGAGLAGCLLATLLGRRGVPVTVYERRPDPRLVGAERGRSINLAISARGLAALERVGLRQAALARALPMPGRMVHALGSPPSFRPYSADGTRSINSISRAELNAALLDCAAATPGVDVRFAHRLSSVADDRVLHFETPDGPREVAADVVLACDGAYSPVRRALQVDAREDFLEHGYKELTIPARDGEFALDPGALHIWPRGSSMMIALPNLDRSFTCTLFWPKSAFSALDSPDLITTEFRSVYPDVTDLMPALVGDYLDNPVGSLVTVRCWPWSRGRIGLVGDAAHAIVPFFGQGANCALEDCIELDECLGAAGSWDVALQLYQQRRKANTDAIADMALENFVEMRDKVNSPIFQAKVAAQHALERRLAGRYVSRYELVSFTTLPYSQIAGRIRRQNLALLGTAAALTAAAAAAGARWGRSPR
jgi:kynurenine 3-monooxygenase